MSKQKSQLKTFILAIILVVLAVTVGVIKTSGSVSASACQAPATSYGTDTITVTIPTAGTYNIWARMQAPSASSDSYMMQIDGTTCYTVGGNSTMPLKSWAWVNYQNGSTTSTISDTLTAGTHTIVLIGTEPSVQIDLIQLLTTTCVPTGTGTNCVTPQAAPPTVTFTSPTSGATVSGSSVAINASATSPIGANGIASVAILVDGTNIATATTSPYTANWNTTKYSNGTHTILATATDTEGQTTSKSEAVTVSNTSATCATAPTVPANLSATDNSPTSVSLTWLGSTATSPCSLSGYRVYRGTTLVGTVGSTTTAYTDTTAASGTSYSYTVVAYDSFGNSAASTPAKIVTPAICTTAPTAPASLTATPTSPTSVSLGWSASTATSPCVVSGYYVYRDGTLLNTTNATTTTFNDLNASPATQYSYTVKAYDIVSASTTSSNASNIATALTPAEPNTTPPSIPSKVTATAPAYNQVVVTWVASTDSTTANTLAGYYVIRNNSTIATLPASATSYTDNTVLASTNYEYNIKSFDNANPPNVSLQSNAANVLTPSAPKPPSKPTPPTNLTATAVSDSQINLAWTASTSTAGIKDYLIYENGSSSPLATVDTTSYGVTGLASGTKYSFTVVAYDTTGVASATSNAASATTQTTVVVTPPTLSVYGIVLNSSNNQQLNGVTVTTTSATGSNVVATTNDDGYYLLANVRPNVYQNYTYSLKGYATTDLFKEFSTGNFELNSYLTPGSTYTGHHHGYRHHFWFIRWN